MTYKAAKLYVQRKYSNEYFTFDAIIPLTPEAKERGMMFQEVMSPQTAMIFSLPPRGFKRVWMQNVFIPLDVLFYRDGEITQILHSLQPMDANTHLSMDKVDGFIEILGGNANRLGIQVGDKIFTD